MGNFYDSTQAAVASQHNRLQELNGRLAGFTGPLG